ncbi:MAG: HAD-IIIA family hydrolase [Phycisphaeraceae bacterium]|nr:HAD-IIIA family hydrolase [Phycisphaeraceae bacterium]
MSQFPDIKLFIFDVDGVLSDGGIYLSDHGIESKRYNVRDGFGIVAARKMGIEVGILTGRSNRNVTLRMRELCIPHIVSGASDKAQGLTELCKLYDIAPEHVAYLGDDLIDLPAMTKVAYPMAVSDAEEAVKAHAKYITTKPGGHGAARDAINHVLTKMGRMDELVQMYLNM